METELKIEDIEDSNSHTKWPELKTGIALPWPKGKRLSVEMITWIARCKVEGISTRELIVVTGLSKSTISRVANDGIKYL